jgi:predicted aldo/keto reductase-like oxidoreductase
MEKRTYKKTGQSISLLGFGNMRLPVKEGTQDIDKELAQSMIDYAYAHGVNYYDTAYMYHEGKSELFIGEALKKYDRSSFNLATKMPLMFIKEEADVDRIFNEQLKKCQVEYFDFYLLHNISREHKVIAEKNKVYEYLAKKKEQGIIRNLGFSFHDHPDVLAATVKQWDFDFTQIQLNYLDWDLQDAKGQHKILKDKGIPIIVMEPVRGGALAKLSEKAIEIYKQADPNSSPASWALRYAATIPEVQVVLSGMSDFAQVQDNIKTFENFKPITAEDQKVIDRALEEYRKSAPIPCTACRYCMDCPSGVDIPRVLAGYNNYRQTTVAMENPPKFFFDMQFRNLGDDKQASNCVNCGLCKTKCPQHIDIPHWMEVISTYAAEGRIIA